MPVAFLPARQPPAAFKAEKMHSSTTTTPKKVLSVIHNIPRKVKTSRSRNARRFRGKENVPPMAALDDLLRMPTIVITSPSSQTLDTSQAWLPRDGMMIIKVSVPSSDDIWKFKVPVDVMLPDFLLRVEKKVGFPVHLVCDMGIAPAMPVTTESTFRIWVAGRIQNGKNTKLIAEPRL
ncbi:uncharacterized protein LAESUDRAFT_422310 [Laetiporus sulphureus 93-53]|uniref:Uncharacterized protein n=1 Tax=Laetiporus sulphureus 93-53 TaxID=1314785 RepID=A0A165GHN4_9APHY|nr:uncharacterized protein LAESUDRAFT_422310 [Laetiporus sulphureus 93-53]KZT10361.1 hypothetical protein LAESUDRAFT_422310 [Laetiporus sulphureus 93-53]